MAASNMKAPGVAFPVINLETLIWRSTDEIEGEIIDSRGCARRPQLIPRSSRAVIIGRVRRNDAHRGVAGKGKGSANLPS